MPVYARLKRIIVEQLGVDEDEVSPEASFYDDLNADAVELVELLTTVEEEFGVEIPDFQARKLSTVQDLVDLLDEQLE
ncbi:MAG: acyl carrier protein [Chloroflexi bacterium]|nr:acyl carrier protein [Chloroflexota bacterium]MBI5955393.1 acyl carrier protein [Chloroflexota bacterium]